MSKARIARALKDQSPHITVYESRRMVSIFLQAIAAEIAQSGTVCLQDIGTLNVTERPERMVQHPVTRMPVKVTRGATVRFKASAALLQRLRQPADAAKT